MENIKQIVANIEKSLIDRGYEIRGTRILGDTVIVNAAQFGILFTIEYSPELLMEFI